MVKRKTYIICHLVLETDALGLEELFERLLLLAVKVSEDSIGILVKSSIPVDVAELVLSQAILQANGDIKRPASRYGTADTRHGNNGDVLKLDVGRRLGNEDQALIQEV